MSGGFMSRMGRPITAAPKFVEDYQAVCVTSLTGPYKPVEEITRNCSTCGSSTVLATVFVRLTRQGPRFLCSYCQNLVRKLYGASSSSEDWRCRRCHGLVYRDQYQKGRAALLREFRQMMSERPQTSFTSGDGSLSRQR